jgi:hypothetical protein
VKIIKFDVMGSFHSTSVESEFSSGSANAAESSSRLRKSQRLIQKIRSVSRQSSRTEDTPKDTNLDPNSAQDLEKQEGNSTADLGEFFFFFFGKREKGCKSHIT